MNNNFNIIGIQEMHSCHLVHRDIKEDNIVFGDQFVVKVIDLSFAGRSDSEVCGTSKYLAPEINKLEVKQFDGIFPIDNEDKKTTISGDNSIEQLRENNFLRFSKVDSFAVGVVLYRFITKNFPFSKASQFDHKYKSIVSKDFSSFWQDVNLLLVSSLQEKSCPAASQEQLQTPFCSYHLGNSYIQLDSHPPFYKNCSLNAHPQSLHSDNSIYNSHSIDNSHFHNIKYQQTHHEPEIILGIQEISLLKECSKQILTCSSKLFTMKNQLVKHSQQLHPSIEKDNPLETLQRTRKISVTKTNVHDDGECLVKIEQKQNNHQELEQTIYQDISGEPSFQAQIEQLKDLIQSLLAYNVDERCGVDQALNHPFFTSVSSSRMHYACVHDFQHFFSLIQDSTI